jgi:hypothetical protein
MLNAMTLENNKEKDKKSQENQMRKIVRVGPSFPVSLWLAKADNLSLLLLRHNKTYNILKQNKSLQSKL